MSQYYHLLNVQLNKNNLSAKIGHLLLRVPEHTLGLEELLDCLGCYLLFYNLNRELPKGQRITKPILLPFKICGRFILQKFDDLPPDAAMHYLLLAAKRNLSLVSLELLSYYFDGNVPQGNEQPPVDFLLQPLKICIIIKNLLNPNTIQLPLNRLKLNVLNPLLFHLLAPLSRHFCLDFNFLTGSRLVPQVEGEIAGKHDIKLSKVCLTFFQRWPR